VQGSLLTWEGGDSGEDLVGLEAGLEANGTCTGEQEVQDGGFDAEIGKGMDIGYFLPFTSSLTEIV
jgi:hypothetical protein